MKKEEFYKKLALYYDLIFSAKDYKKDTEFVKKIVKRYKKSKGNKLLDIGCGTGNHDKYLKSNFSIIGIDKYKEMLSIAKRKVKGVKYLQKEMQNFKFKEKFDVVIALFGVMHYNKNKQELKKTLKNIYNHLEKGGILIFDFGLMKENFKNHVGAECIDAKGYHITFVNNQFRIDKNHTETTLVFIIRKNKKETIEIDHHIQTLFSLEEIKQILKEIGFKFYLYDRDYSGKKFTKKSKAPIFVAVKS